jgi:predicted transcriptional regulator
VPRKVTPSRSPGAKRPPAELEALQLRALSAIKAQPGLRVEELNKALHLKPGTLALPIKKLLAEKAIRTTGERRATKYFAAGSAKPAKRTKRK